MVNITFAGTNLTNGKPDSGSSCVTGFDQAGFVMGTSASLFNVRWYVWTCEYPPHGNNFNAGASKQRREVTVRI